MRVLRPSISYWALRFATTIHFVQAKSCTLWKPRKGHFAAPPKSFRIAIPVKKASPHGQNGFLTKWNLILRLFPPLRPSFTWMDQSVLPYWISDQRIAVGALFTTF